MGLIRIQQDPTRRQLLVFGLVWAVVFGFLGYAARDSASTWLPRVLWALAATVPLAGLVYAPVLKWAYLGLAYVTFPIGWTISHLVLALIYYAVLTPIGLVMRLGGRDPMGRTLEPSRETYWLDRKTPEKPDRYFRQF